MIKRMVSAEQKAYLELQAATKMLELNEPPPSPAASRMFLAQKNICIQHMA